MVGKVFAVCMPELEMQRHSGLSTEKQISQALCHSASSILCIALNVAAAALTWLADCVVCTSVAVIGRLLLRFCQCFTEQHPE